MSSIHLCVHLLICCYIQTRIHLFGDMSIHASIPPPIHPFSSSFIHSFSSGLLLESNRFRFQLTIPPLTPTTTKLVACCTAAVCQPSICQTLNLPNPQSATPSICQILNPPACLKQQDRLHAPQQAISLKDDEPCLACNLLFHRFTQTSHCVCVCA